MELDYQHKGSSLHLSRTTKRANQKLTPVDKKKKFIWADQNQNNE